MHSIAKLITDHKRSEPTGPHTVQILSTRRNRFCEATRQDGPGRRSTCHAPPSKAAL
jgi:hypothetical protein